MNTSENNPLNSSPNSFGLPGGYFQRSAAAIANKIEWQEEHAAYTLLLKHRDLKSFAVPADYFSSSAEQLDFIQFEKLSAVTKVSPFAVPENYFEAAATQLLANALTGADYEPEALPMLSAIARQQAFKTPENYFAAQQEKMSALLSVKKEGRILQLFGPKAKYAAAALLVAALGFWAYATYLRPVSQAQDCGTMACLDRMELLNSKTLEKLDNEELYELVNSKKLEEHLNGAADKTTNTTKDSSSKEDAIDDLPDGI